MHTRKPLFLVCSLLVPLLSAIRLTPLLSSESQDATLCQSGLLQSPIDISPEHVIHDCGSAKLQLFALDRPIEARINRNSSVLQISTPFAFSFAQLIDMEGVPALYESRELSVHFPSEHRLEGRQYAAELQIMYNISEGFDAWQRNLIIAVVLDLQQEDSHEDTVFDHINLLQVSSFALQLKEIVLEGIRDHNFYYYQGSLTESPCSEIVNWLVSGQILPIKQKHLDLLESLNDGKRNNRQVQALNGRHVYAINSSCNVGASVFTQIDENMAQICRNITLGLMFLVFLLL